LDLIPSSLTHQAAPDPSRVLYFTLSPISLIERNFPDASLIKFYCANVLNKVIDRALQSLGAAGMTDDFPIAGYYRSERAARIYDGADEVHKISAAKQILKQYS